MGKVLHLVRATIEALSPLSTASGDGSIYDVALVRDANGLPEIAASSIQGVLRHLHEERFGEEETKALFGFAKGDSGQTARLFFSFGHVHGADNVAVNGLRVEETSGSMADELLQRLAAEAPFVRDHVALNERHVADKRSKFERVAVPRGTRFSFEIAMWGDAGKEEEDAKALHDLLSLTKHPAFRLGGAARRGYGKVKLIAAGKAVMPLSNPAAIRDIRKRPASDLSGPFKPVDMARDLAATDADAVTIALTLKPMGMWRFGSTGLALRTGKDELRSRELIVAGRNPDSRDKDVDAASVREPWIDWSGNRGRWCEPQRAADQGRMPKITLAGTAIKGPLAHRTLFHWNRLRPGADGAAGRMLDPSEWESEPPGSAKRKAIIAEIAASKLGDRKPGGESPWTVRPEALERLFGSVKEAAEELTGQEDGASRRRRGSAARLIVDDADIEVKPENVVALDHNSLDRFTGGVRNRLLFSEEVAFGGEISVTITILPPRDEKGAVLPSDRWPPTLLRAFCHALRDLCEGRLALGARSLGFCTAAAPAFRGADAQAWKTAWDEADASARQGGKVA
jgi:CRISPR/Cas system CSM-associated protein Csm3 (group 7 of RAMP superfamily)